MQNGTKSIRSIVLSYRTEFYLNLMYCLVFLDILREIILLTLFTYNPLASEVLNIKANKTKLKKKKKKNHRTGRICVMSTVSKILKTHLYDLEPTFKMFRLFQV